MVAGGWILEHFFPLWKYNCLHCPCFFACVHTISCTMTPLLRNALMSCKFLWVWEAYPDPLDAKFERTVNLNKFTRFWLQRSDSFLESLLPISSKIAGRWAMSTSELFYHSSRLAGPSLLSRIQVILISVQRWIAREKRKKHESTQARTGDLLCTFVMLDRCDNQLRHRP